MSSEPGDGTTVLPDEGSLGTEVVITTSQTDEKASKELNFTKAKKVIYTREFVFVLGVTLSIFLLFTVKSYLAIFPIVIFTLLAGITKIKTYHRGVWTFFGKRLPIAVSEGLNFMPPFFGGIIELDTREKTETLSYENFMGNDGIPFSFTLFLVWHIARRENEIGWTWYKPWTWGKLLLAVTNLEPGAAEKMVLKIGKSRAEVELVKYKHNQVLGFSIQELEELFKQDLESAQTAPAASLNDSREADSIRTKITNTVKAELNERLNARGIIVTDVAFEDFNLPKDMLDYIQQILRTKFEKASEMIDIKIDLQRVVMLMNEATQNGCPLTFKDAYMLMRGHDIEEIAAKGAGQIGLLLKKLSSHDWPELAEVKNLIQTVT
ncbi:MAG: hypothetical protein ACNFW9_03845 [Candidatus Kerfeldbacteria bacterium]